MAEGSVILEGGILSSWLRIYEQNDTDNLVSASYPFVNLQMIALGQVTRSLGPRYLWKLVCSHRVIRGEQVLDCSSPGHPERGSAAALTASDQFQLQIHRQPPFHNFSFLQG